MASNLPPSENLPIFDSGVFNTGNDALTYNSAVSKFLTFPVAQGTETFSDINTLGNITGNNATFSGIVDFTNISSPPHCSATPSAINDLCNKQYVDSQSALTAYQLYFNYSQSYTVPSGATYNLLTQTDLITSPNTGIAWATSGTTRVLLGAFFNSLVGINIPTSIPAGIWTLLCYANLDLIAYQGRVGVFFEIIGTTAAGAETVLFTSAISVLINTVTSLIGANSVVATIPLISLVGYTGVGVKVYIQANVVTPTSGSVFFQKSNAYSSVLTSFAVTQSPDLLSLNNTWTGTNTFNKDIIVNGVEVGSNGLLQTTILGNGAGNTSVSTGQYNTMIGYNSGGNMTSGSVNTLIGQSAGLRVTIGTNNTSIGAASGGNITTGLNNTIIGSQAGNSITGTSQNTCIGYNSNVSTGLTYGTALGANSLCSTSNTIQLGRTTDNVNCPNTLSVTGIITATGGVDGNASTATTATTATNLSGGSVIATTGSFSSNMVLTGYPLITSTFASSNFILATNSGNSNSIQLSPQGNTALSIGSGGNSVFSGNLTSNGTLTANVGIVNIGNLSFTGLAPTITTNSTEILTLATPATTGGTISINCQSSAQIIVNPTVINFYQPTNYGGKNMTGANAIQAATATDLILRTPVASTNTIFIAPAQVNAVSVFADGTTRFAQQTLYTYGTTITATVTLITTAPLKNFYIITAVANATVSLPTASATYAGSDITFRRQTNVAVITFNQTGGATVIAPYNSNTLAISASLTATQFSTRFTCDGTNWYQLATQ